MELKSIAALYGNLLEHPAWKMLEAQIQENIQSRQKSAFALKPGPEAGYDIARAQGYVAALEQVLQIPRGAVDAGKQLTEAEEKVYGE